MTGISGCASFAYSAKESSLSFSDFISGRSHIAFPVFRRPISSCSVSHSSTDILTEEVKLVRSKGDVDPELLTLRLVKTGLICNDKTVAVLLTEFHAFQVKAAAEGAILSVIACFVCNDTSCITDMLAAGIGKVQLVIANRTIISNSFFLVEIQ